MKAIDFEQLRHDVLARMEKELSPLLYYHGVHHTRDDVLPTAEQLGIMACVSPSDLLLLRTAALYHDIGYTQDYVDHENISAAIVSEELPDIGYTPEQIHIIVNMIMATRMPQNPQTQLEQFLCDADLNSLGSIDFFVKSQSLRLEMNLRGTFIPLREWYEGQLEFLLNHTYFTKEARELRDSGKQKNIEELRSILER